MIGKFGYFTLAVLAALGLSSGMALAATTTGELAVTATVLDTCTVTTAGALSFVSVATSGGNETTPNSITVLCTATRTGLSVALGGGGSPVAGVRRMADGIGNYLPYYTDSDAGHTSSVAINGTIYSGGITAAVAVVIPVYGQIPAGNYASGVYTDTLVVTLNY